MNLTDSSEHPFPMTTQSSLIEQNSTNINIFKRNSYWTEYFTQAAGPYLSLVTGYILTYVRLEHIQQQNKIPHQKTVTGLFTALFYVGAIVGVCWIALVYEIFGRRGPLIETSIIISVTWMFRNIRRSEISRSVVRFFLGLAYGAFALGLPIFLTESSQVDKRGHRGFSYIADGLVGSFLGFSVYTYIRLKWLQVLLNQIIIIGLVQIALAAQSPYWQPPPKTFGMIGHDLKIVLSNLRAWKLIGISIGLMILQEVTCWLPMSKIMPSLLRQLNPKMTMEHTEIVLILCQLMGVASTYLLVDEVGRRPFLVLSLGLLGLSTGAFGMFLYWMKDERCCGGEVKLNPVIWLGVGSTCAFCVALNLGIRPIAWLTMAELLPVQAKGFTAAIVVLTNLVISYLMSVAMTPVLTVSASGGQGQRQWAGGLHWIVWLLSLISFVGILHVFFLVPEMKGKDFPMLNSTII